MQPFTVESINETLEQFGVSPASVKSAVDAVETATEAVSFLSDAIVESPHGAVIDWSQTLEEGLDALSVPCSHCGVGIAYRVEDSTSNAFVEVAMRGIAKTISPHYRPREDSFHEVAHAVEKAVDGHIRIFSLRSTHGTDTYTYAVLRKHDWERLLHAMGNSAFNALFIGLDGKHIV